MPPEPLPFGTPLEGTNAGEWGAAICRYAKWPVTAANVYTFAGWFLREGGGGANDPMNTTIRDKGATGSINSVGVQNYDNPTDGIAATVDTLRHGYPAICADFQEGKGLEYPSLEASIELGRWSGGGYHSITPVAVPIPEEYPYYSRFDNVLRYVDGEGHKSSEFILVTEYDRKRKHSVLYAKRLHTIRAQLGWLASRLNAVIEHSSALENEKHYRSFRLIELDKRIENKKLV